MSSGLDTHRSRSIAAAVLALVVASVAVSGCFGGSKATPRNAPVQKAVPKPPQLPLSPKVDAPQGGAYLGVFLPAVPFLDADAVARFDTLQGKPVGIVQWFQPWSHHGPYRFDPGACVAVWRRGKVPMITWEPWDSSKAALRQKSAAYQPGYKLSRIIAGDFDPYIRSWAKQIHDLGGPIMLRPMHEMNGDWYPWSGMVNGNRPGQYREAWRHIHDIFQQEGATNVTWVWSVNAQTVPETPENDYGAYYPGDDYVDWTAISGFNWGTSASWSRWHSFSFFYGRPLAYLHDLKKPICIAEFGCAEQGGSKAEWLADAYQQIRANPDVKAVVYFETKQTLGRKSIQNWNVNSTPASLKAFKQAIAPPYYLAGKPRVLTRWAGSLRKDQWQFLISIRPVYIE